MIPNTKNPTTKTTLAIVVLKSIFAVKKFRKKIPERMNGIKVLILIILRISTVIYEEFDQSYNIVLD